jgi:tetratricopeptide (TPR) repeat protein
MDARRTARFAEAKHHLAAAVALLRQDGTRAELAQTIRALGENDRALNDNTAACKHYEESIAIYRETGDSLSLAHTIRHLGDIHHDAGRSGLAEPCYQEALALYRSHDNPPPIDLANAIRPLGVLKSETGAVEQAMALLREARDLYETANVEQGVAGCSARLAVLARQVGDFEQSRQWLRSAVVAAEKSGDEDSVRFVNTIRAQIGDE